MQELTKLEIVDRLGRRFGYSSLLEISTPRTGLTGGAFDRTQFPRYDRLMYRCPDGFDDGGPVSYMTRAKSSHGLTQQLLQNGTCAGTYDVVFVDPYHTYENTMSDLLAAFALVRAGGAIVVHDCHPTDPGMVSPLDCSDLWCGVTYWAFLDFVLGRAGIMYFTVDADYGCGVVFKGDSTSRPPTTSLEIRWRVASSSDERRFRFFRENETLLLHLISADRFHRWSEAAETSTTAQCQ